MKKIIFSTALTLALGTTFSFASTKDEIGAQVTSSFKKEFSGARDVRWEKDKSFIKATFLFNDQVMFAYYTSNGDLIGVVRNLLSDKLPISLMEDLRLNYSDYWITDLFEFASESGSTYYVTLQTANETLTLKSEGTSGWTNYKRAKKNN